MPIFNPNDLTLARQRVKDRAWSAEILAAIRTRADAWRAHPADAPTLAGGWVHDYTCPDHWCALVFAPASPHAHRCPLGETRVGEKLDAAWRVIEHRRLANAARDLALVFALTDERAYADAAGVILTQYAENYPSYAGFDAAPAWMLKGRAFQQALTEAIWAVPIAQTYDLVRATLAPEQETLIVNAFLRPMIGTLTIAQDDLVQQQNRLKSNYNAWLIAALGLLGYALRDQMLIERAIDGPAGFRAHLAAAILPDGMEHEATPYYHNFVALGYSILAEAARANDRDLYAERGPDGQSIEMMWRAFASLAFADGTIPQIGDGAYWRGSTFASEICEVYEIALARTDIGEYAWLLRQTYRGNARDAWSALLFGERDIADAPIPARKSVCLASSGIALLRDGTRTQEICVPFGAYAGSHSHLDRAALQIFPWSTDPGNTPYGTAARLEWHQHTAAHNAIVVDEQSQAQCQARLLNWEVTPDKTTLWLAADDAYPGVRLTRSITLTNGIVTDSTLIDSAEEHTYDWIAHVDGECLIEDLALGKIADDFTATGAYRLIAPYARRHCAGKFQLTVKYAKQIFRLDMTADTPLEIILARAPARADAPMQPRQMLIARARQR
ncbi:MAG: alginate lyase family protein, partial [Anaerolineales bacterium]|nr:alginate lyase family protein [Anaerolineales bacterium]